MNTLSENNEYLERKKRGMLFTYEKNYNKLLRVILIMLLTVLFLVLYETMIIFFVTELYVDEYNINNALDLSLFRLNMWIIDVTLVGTVSFVYTMYKNGLNNNK